MTSMFAQAACLAVMVMSPLALVWLMQDKAKAANQLKWLDEHAESGDRALLRRCEEQNKLYLEDPIQYIKKLERGEL